MIGRFFLLATASAAALAAVTTTVSIIVADIAGEQIEKAWAQATKPRATTPIEDKLAGTKDLTFFKSVKVHDRPYSVMMGIAFATPEALAKGIQKNRWCYCNVRPKDGGVLRQVELATQDGANPPRYSDFSNFSASDLATIGETVESLATIARKHCVFEREPAGPGALAKRITTIVLKGEAGEGDRS